MACFNTSHPDFIQLLKETNLKSEILAAGIEAWMNANNTFEFPTKKQIMEFLKIPISRESPGTARARILKATNANSAGFINPIRFKELLKLIGDYNREMGYQALGLRQANPARGKQSGDYYIVPQSPQFQLASELKVDSNKELNEKLLQWAKNNGIEVLAMQELIKRFSSTGDIFEGSTGVAILLEKIIGIDPSKEKLDTLAEEIAHFATAFLENDPSVKRALERITETEEYKQVKEDYKNIYSEEAQFKKEALDKILANTIISEFRKTEENSSILDYLKAIFNKFWRKITSIRNSPNATDFIKNELASIARSIIAETTFDQVDITDAGTYFQIEEDFTNPEVASKNESHKQKIAFLDKALEQMESRLSELLKQSKEKRATVFLNSQIAALKATIKKQQFDAALLKVIEIAGAELTQLETVLDKNRDENKLLEAKTATLIDNFTLLYKELFNNFGNQLKQASVEESLLPDGFSLEKEIERIQTLINDVITRNNSHIKQIRINTLKRANLDANGEIIDPDFDPEKNEETITGEDASWWRFYVGNYKFAKNNVIRLVDKLISDTVKSVKRIAVRTSNELLQAQAALEAAGYKVEDLVEKDKKGLPTQYLIRNRDYNTYFAELKKVQESIAKTLGVEFFEDINKEALSENELLLYKTAFRDFFKEHTVTITNKLGEETVVPRAFNTKFKELMAVPEVKAYYDLLTEKIKIAVNKLPINYRTENMYYKIPGIRKQFLERLTNNNRSFLENIKDVTIGEGFKEATQKDEDDTQFGDLRQLNNKVIPIFFTKRLSDPNNLSLDLSRSVTIFTEMAENFEAMNKLAPQLLTVQKGLAEQQYRKGKFKPELIDGKQTVDYKILEVLLDQYVYGISKKDAEINIGGKVFSASKMVDKLGTFIRTNNLALNLITSTAGFIKGTVDSFVEDFIGQYTTVESKSWASGEYLKNLPQVASESLSHQKNNKMHLLLQLANVIELSKSVKNTNKSKFISETISRDLLFINYRTGDYGVKGRSTLAILDNNRLYNNKFVNKLEFIKIKEKQGVSKQEINKEWETLRDKSFYNAFEVVNKKLEIKKEFQPYVNEGIQNKVFGQVEHLTHLIDGTLSETDRGALSRTILGQFPLMHRGWFINLIDTRFRKERMNYRTGQKEIGVLNAFFIRMIGQEIIKKKQFLTPRLAYNQLNTAEKKAVNKAFWDILFLNIIAILAGIVNAAADDEKEDFTMQLAAYQMNRILLEQKSSWSLKETIEMIDEPVVGVRTIKDLLDFTEAFNFDEYKSGMYEGDTHAFKWWVRKTPGFKNIYEMQFPELKNRFIKTQVLDSRTYEIIKAIKENKEYDPDFSLGNITGITALKGLLADENEVTPDDIQYYDDLTD
jgi:hypothetical protein